jgi:peroxiredoxin Q/BCP
MSEAQPPLPMPAVGTACPDFSITIQDGSVRSKADYAGHRLAIYFYPKDATPGCTAQACSLNDGYDALRAAGIAVLGVSPDPVKSHVKFIDKHGLRFDLGADTEQKMHRDFGVWGWKKFMGRAYEGTLRTTFLIEADGTIAAVLDKPDTKNHAQEVLSAFAG